MDAEAGGAADLQTDVMRFMAIISLCLVAIFALVQSIPLTPKVVAESPEVPAPTPEQAPPQEAVAEPVKAIETAAPTSMPHEVAPPEPVAQSTVDAEPPRHKTPAVVGFTLQFADDQALTRLVAKNDVALYAVAKDQSLRMSVRNGQITFQTATAPTQMHEMDLRTVPQAVLRALRRSGTVPPAAVKWGVTLPDKMSVQLDRYLREQSGGNLIINADGTLRLEV